MSAARGSGPVVVVYDPPPVLRHPCEVGAHRWAWAQLVSGGVRQVCGYCGTVRR